MGYNTAKYLWLIEEALMFLTESRITKMQKNHLYHEMYSDYNNSDCIYFYGSWGSDCWRIDIYSECSDAPRAADLIREHRGKYYDM